MKGKVYFIGGEYDGKSWDHPVHVGEIVPRIKWRPIDDWTINNFSLLDTVKEEFINYKAEVHQSAGTKRLFLVDPELPRDKVIIKIEKYFF
ncbi:hypothetical protein ABLB96_15070 [Acinetobacter sp. XH1741]|uniref:hypothetical protein n=1 Tax=unclassified Acinetobacter TaxID=196816 RepID=UPI0032B5F5AB